jgi:hypothetical protein
VLHSGGDFSFQLWSLASLPGNIKATFILLQKSTQVLQHLTRIANVLICLYRSASWIQMNSFQNAHHVKQSIQPDPNEKKQLMT